LDYDFEKDYLKVPQNEHFKILEWLRSRRPLTFVSTVGDKEEPDTLQNLEYAGGIIGRTSRNPDDINHPNLWVISEYYRSFSTDKNALPERTPAAEALHYLERMSDGEPEGATVIRDILLEYFEALIELEKTDDK
jgi:hypothetical protein